MHYLNNSINMGNIPVTQHENLNIEMFRRELQALLLSAQSIVSDSYFDSSMDTDHAREQRYKDCLSQIEALFIAQKTETPEDERRLIQTVLGEIDSLFTIWDSDRFAIHCAKTWNRLFRTMLQARIAASRHTQVEATISQTAENVRGLGIKEEDHY